MGGERQLEVAVVDPANRRVAHHAGEVDDDLQASTLGLDPGDELLNRACVSHVERGRLSRPAGRDQLFDDCPGAVIVEVGHHNMRPPLTERGAARPAQPSAGARHERRAPELSLAVSLGQNTVIVPSGCLIPQSQTTFGRVASMGDMFSLEGKTALVTGGVHGLGAMSTRALLDAGASVWATTRKADEAATELERHPRCNVLVADLAAADGVSELAAAVGDAVDALDILVNNAGVTWGAPFEEYPAAAWTKVLQLNVAVPFGLVQALVPLLERGAQRDPPARIVNLGSIDGHAVGLFDNWAYPPSKAAMHQLTRVLACRLGPHGITVNAIAPGVVHTKMTDILIEQSGDRIVAGTPLGRLATEPDLAGALVFLSSQASAFMTGAVLPVDGGASLATWGGAL
jgi:NAD(P)-dependent dehydrogenase (short-subunit alcohol dehydrogenase family)